MKKQTKVRVQQNKSGQFYITIPENLAKNYLNVKKGDRIEFLWENRIMKLEKVEE